MAEKQMSKVDQVRQLREDREQRNEAKRKRAPKGSGFDKKAYQRDLMRKRRAEAKAK